MASSLNEVTLIGNLGQDPELRYTGKGQPVCNLSLATTYKPKEGAEQTEWHRVVAWRTDAENCSKYLKKGRQIMVRGRIATRVYEKDGQRRTATEIMAERIIFLGGNNGPANQQALPAPTPRAALPPAQEGAPGDDDDNVPW